MYIFYNANPSGKSTGDCVIRAIATITGKTWVEVHEDLSFYSRKMYDMMDTNTVWHKYLKDLGFDIFAISDPWLTVDDFCKRHPYGKYLLGTGRHLVAVIDGDYYDAWDSGREIPVFYWMKGD